MGLMASLWGVMAGAAGPRQGAQREDEQPHGAQPSLISPFLEETKEIERNEGEIGLLFSLHSIFFAWRASAAAKKRGMRDEKKERSEGWRPAHPSCSIQTFNKFHVFISPRSNAAGALVDCSSFAGPVRSFI